MGGEGEGGYVWVCFVIHGNIIKRKYIKKFRRGGVPLSNFVYNSSLTKQSRQTISAVISYPSVLAVRKSFF